MRFAPALIATLTVGCSTSYEYPCDMPRFALDTAVTVHDVLACPAGAAGEFTIAAGSANLRVKLIGSDRLWMVAKDGQGRELEIRGKGILPMPPGRAKEALAFTHHMFLNPLKTEATLELTAPGGAQLPPIVLRYKAVACTCEGHDSL